jgi:hypothetical protein
LSDNSKDRNQFHPAGAGRIDSCKELYPREDAVEAVFFQNGAVVIDPAKPLRWVSVVLEIFFTPDAIEPVDETYLSTLEIDRGDTSLPDSASGVEQTGNEKPAVVETAAGYPLHAVVIEFVKLLPVESYL